MHCRAIAPALVVLHALSIPALAGTPACDPLKDIDAFVARTMKEFEVPGLAIAVVKDDKVVLAKGYGVRTLGQPGAVDEKTLFAIGSCSKAFTSAALGILVDEGKAKWDDPVTKYLRGFELYDPYVTREVTLRDLLAHRCGLGRHDLLWYGSGLSRDEILRRIRYARPASGFRSKYGYQNIMVLAAGQVVPAVTGKSWDDFVAERLFKPLGMKSSNTSVTALSGCDDVATPHERVEGKVQVLPWRNVDNIAPAGAINSNAEDMARWVRFQLGDGTFAKERLLSAATLAEMHKPQTVVPFEGVTMKVFPSCHVVTYGLGWHMHDYRGRQVVGHAGNIDGMTALVALLPEEKLGVAVLTNFGSALPPFAVKYQILDAYLHAAPTDWIKEFALVARTAEKAQKDAREKEEKARVKGTKPSLPLANYVGIYKDNLYGETTVTLEGGQLKAVCGPEIRCRLEHWQNDTFCAKGTDKRSPNLFATFHVGEDGTVEEVKLSFTAWGEWTAKRTRGAVATPAALRLPPRN